MFINKSGEAIGLCAAIALTVAGCGSQGANSALMVPGIKVGAHGTSRALSALATFPTIHVLTADYFADKFPTVSVDQMAPYLSWAWSTATESPSLRSAGVKTMLYTNPNRQAPGGPMYTSDESTFAHDCNGNRITFPAHNGIYLMDPTSTVISTLWKQTVATVGAQFDAIYDDTADNLAGATALPCNYAATAWTAASNALNGSLGSPIMYNGLGNLNNVGGVYSISNAIGLNPTTVGGMMEGCYSNQSNTIAKPKGAVWQVEENSEIQMAQQQKQFICRGLNLTPASSATDLRTYMTASFLMTYDLGTSVLSEKFSNASNFNEEPESQLVVMDPIVPTPGDISGLQVSTKVYGREYGNCYISGVPVGSCAVVVNVDSSARAHPFPYPSKYQHTLALTGGGILDGGTATALGPAPGMTVPGNDAIIAFQ